MPKVSISKPELMNITIDGETFIGGSQEWYTDEWHKKAGCGPVTASNIIWYILRKNDLTPDYLQLIQEMFGFVTPGLQGVNTSAIFVDGLMRFASENGMHLSPCVLEIPRKKSGRPDNDTLCKFILNALNADSPVAFLNLSNGTVSALESWHWVTILTIDPEKMTTDITDLGKVITIDISEWIKTSILGGALVYFYDTHANINKV